MKIKDFYLSLLSESQDYFHIDSKSIAKVDDMNFDKAQDYIKIDFETTYGKKGSLVTKYSEFSKWFKANINKYENPFKTFAEKFLKHSKEVAAPATESVNEIVDDDGSIMSNDDKPNNSTNSMVGSKNTWDLDHVYKSSIPKSQRYYSGYFGIGVVTW